MKQTLILAVESSCDETAVAVVADGKEILSNVVATQIDVHKEFGGVIPEVASRIHVEHISMVIEEALHKRMSRWKTLMRLLLRRDRVW